MRCAQRKNECFHSSIQRVFWGINLSATFNTFTIFQFSHCVLILEKFYESVEKQHCIFSQMITFKSSKSKNGRKISNYQGTWSHSKYQRLQDRNFLQFNSYNLSILISGLCKTVESVKIYESSAITEKKRLRQSACSDLDKKSYSWFVIMRPREAELIGDVLCQICAQLAWELVLEVTASNGFFLDNFVKDMG